MKREVKILGKSFYSRSLKDVAGLKSVQHNVIDIQPPYSLALNKQSKAVILIHSTSALIKTVQNKTL